jgi:hypothetical protein
MTDGDRKLQDDELALVYEPEGGLRLELPQDDLPIGIDGAVLAGVYVRLSQGGEWAEELKRWVIAELPAMPIM